MANVNPTNQHFPITTNNDTHMNITDSHNNSLLQPDGVDGFQFNGWLVFVGVVGTPFGLYIMEMIVLALTMFKVYDVVRVWTIANTLAHIRKLCTG